MLCEIVKAHDGHDFLRFGLRLTWFYVITYDWGSRVRSSNLSGETNGNNMFKAFFLILTYKWGTLENAQKYDYKLLLSRGHAFIV